jgi:hypothetical protein
MNTDPDSKKLQEFKIKMVGLRKNFSDVTDIVKQIFAKFHFEQPLPIYNVSYIWNRM